MKRCIAAGTSVTAVLQPTKSQQNASAGIRTVKFRQPNLAPAQISSGISISMLLPAKGGGG
jgi:hypothetical protein